MLSRKHASSLFKKSPNQFSKHYPYKNENRNVQIIENYLLNLRTKGYSTYSKQNSNIKVFNKIYISRINNFPNKCYHTTRNLNKDRSGNIFLRSLGLRGGLFGLSFLTPIVLGSVLLFLAYYAFDYLTKPLGDNENPEDLLLSDNTVALLKKMPTRLGSRIWGYLTHLTVPTFLRKPIYGLYSIAFGCNLDEMTKELNEYKSLNEFFTRRLKDDVRTIASTPMVSPVDGTVLHFGKAENEWVEQIKGIKYKLESMLGEDVSDIIKQYQPPQQSKSSFDKYPNDLYYMVIYLAPGDYHGIHSPVDWTIKHARHFPGHLFSVSPKSSALIRNLLAVNERICLNGFWDHGFFSLTPVGAYNVGSITLEFDDKIKTNVAGHVPEGPHFDSYYENLKSKKGECISFFNLGSTVVLLFQAPPNWQWHVNQYEKVKLGQPLGSFKS